MIQVAADGQIGQIGIPLYERSVWAINGRSWPSTDRLSATVGDSLRWRVINLTTDGHPMHLHGFYYSVDAIDGPPTAVRAMEPPSPRVVTARLAAFAGMSMTWVPERSGNWLFHCHFADHVVPHGALGGESPALGVARIALAPKRAVSAEHAEHAEHADTANQAATAMAGLITGISVRERRGRDSACRSTSYAASTSRSPSSTGCASPRPCIGTASSSTVTPMAFPASRVQARASPRSSRRTTRSSPASRRRARGPSCITRTSTSHGSNARVSSAR